MTEAPTSVSAATRRRITASLRASRSDVLSAWSASQLDSSRIAKYGIVGAREEDRAHLERVFLTPLFDLLLLSIESAEPAHRAVYLDERLRYAPHQASPEVRREFFSEVLPLDEAALLKALARDPELSTQALATVTELHEPLLAPPGGEHIRMLALGDCLMNEVRVFLPGACRERGLDVDMRCQYFGALLGKSIPYEQVDRFLEQSPMDLIAFSFLSYEGVAPYKSIMRQASTLGETEIERRADLILSAMEDFLERLRSRTEAPFLIHNASGLPLGRWRRRLPVLPSISRPHRKVLERLNTSIEELVKRTRNALLLDERGVATRHGHRECSAEVVPRRISRLGMFHTSRIGAYLAAQYLEVVQSYAELRRAKVLLVDFDNTLWNGVMADGNVDHHRDRQQLLRRLKDVGMLLVAVSKNDAANVRWSEMDLAPEDFALLKVSWDPKVLSIQQAAHELDLGLDSFVFIDDSPEERELARRQLPELRVLDSNGATTWRSLERLFAFPNTRQTEEARERTSMYRAQASRRRAVAESIDPAAVLAELGLHVRIGLARAKDLDRLEELVRRTNQFNTTTIRYERGQLRRLIDSHEHGVYVAELSDTFGDFGLVATAIVKRDAPSLVFESFVMSCRAMGFGLEQALLEWVLMAEGGMQKVVGRFVPTDRNAPASSLFAEAGFEASALNEWTLEGTSPRRAPPRWLAVQERG